MRRAVFLALVLACPLAFAQPPKSPVKPPPPPAAKTCPGVLIGGSKNVLAEGKQAGRIGDGACVIAVVGSNNVQINGLGALRVGDNVVCQNGKTGVIVGGATSVFVNGKPLAGAGSRVAGC
jgi:uncharacterized Zn-binding protein involved in type VI secretion